MEGQGEVKLLGVTYSPFVARVRIALNLKGISYEFIEENLQNKSQLLLQSNPVYKKIPVLIHDGKPICESMIIVQYINETWTSGTVDLMPKDPYDRALARFWTAFVDDKIFVKEVLGQGEEQQKAVEETVANLMLMEEALRTTFEGKPFFGGEHIGLVDIALGSMASWIVAIQQATNVKLVEKEKMPLLSAWMDRFTKTEGVKEAMPDTAKLLEIAKGIRARLSAAQAAK
uniref:glutathione transferase n=1 Tax=Araucaria cunninghamii TaxID=56994 RepID=A0A0D6QVA4_ARACU